MTRGRGIQGKDTVIVERKNYSVIENAYGFPEDEKIFIEFNNCLIGWNSTSDDSSVTQRSIETEATIFFPLGSVFREDDVFIFGVTDYGEPQRWEKVGKTINWNTPVGSRLKTKVIVDVKRKDG